MKHTRIDRTMITKPLESARQYFRDKNGITKLPGSVIGGFSRPELLAVMRVGWVRRIGDRVVITQKGYLQS